MQTKANVVDYDGFDPDEALKASVEKRKCLLKRLLENYQLQADNTESSQDGHQTNDLSTYLQKHVFIHVKLGSVK